MPPNMDLNDMRGGRGRHLAAERYREQAFEQLLLDSLRGGRHHYYSQHVTSPVRRLAIDVDLEYSGDTTVDITLSSLRAAYDELVTPLRHHFAYEHDRCVVLARAAAANGKLGLHFYFPGVLVAGDEAIRRLRTLYKSRIKRTLWSSLIQGARGDVMDWGCLMSGCLRPPGSLKPNSGGGGGTDSLYRPWAEFWGGVDGGGAREFDRTDTTFRDWLQRSSFPAPSLRLFDLMPSQEQMSRVWNALLEPLTPHTAYLHYKSHDDYYSSGGGGGTSSSAAFYNTRELARHLGAEAGIECEVLASSGRGALLLLDETEHFRVHHVSGARNGKLCIWRYDEREQRETYVRTVTGAAAITAMAADVGPPYERTPFPLASRHPLPIYDDLEDVPAQYFVNPLGSAIRRLPDGRLELPVIGRLELDEKALVAKAAAAFAKSAAGTSEVTRIADVADPVHDFRFRHPRDIMPPLDPTALSVVCVTGKCSSGKTEFAVRLIGAGGPRILYVVPRRDLADDVYKRMCDEHGTQNVDHYKHCERDADGRFIARRRVMVICYFSLWRLRLTPPPLSVRGPMDDALGRAFTDQFDTLVVDEVNTLVRDSTQDIHDFTRALNEAALRALMRQAKLMLQLEADYSAINSVYLPALRYVDNEHVPSTSSLHFYLLHNTSFKMATGRRIVRLPKFAALLDWVCALLLDHKRVAVFFASVDKLEVALEYIRERCGCNVHELLVTGASKRVQDGGDGGLNGRILREHINLLMYTTAMGVGVNVSVRDHFDAVGAYMSGNLSVLEQMQAFERVRYYEHGAVYLSRACNLPQRRRRATAAANDDMTTTLRSEAVRCRREWPSYLPPALVLDERALHRHNEFRFRLGNPDALALLIEHCTKIASSRQFVSMTLANFLHRGFDVVVDQRRPASSTTAALNELTFRTLTTGMVRRSSSGQLLTKDERLLGLLGVVVAADQSHGIPQHFSKLVFMHQMRTSVFDLLHAHHIVADCRGDAQQYRALYRHMLEHRRGLPESTWTEDAARTMKRAEQLYHVLRLCGVQHGLFQVHQYVTELSRRRKKRKYTRLEVDHSLLDEALFPAADHTDALVTGEQFLCDTLRDLLTHESMDARVYRAGLLPTRLSDVPGFVRRRPLPLLRLVDAMVYQFAGFKLLGSSVSAYMASHELRLTLGVYYRWHSCGDGGRHGICGGAERKRHVRVNDDGSLPSTTAQEPHLPCACEGQAEPKLVFIDDMLAALDPWPAIEAQDRERFSGAHDMSEEQLFQRLLLESDGDTPARRELKKRLRRLRQQQQ